MRSRSFRSARPTRRARALLCVVGVSGALGLVGVPTATSAEIRTETKLGGFSVSVNAAPIKILLDDETLPIPRPEGGAVVEADLAFTQAELATGPASLGLASSLWPGNLLGQGLPTATNNEVSQYPIKAESRYPDKPYTDNGAIDFQGQRIAETNSAIMHSSALGLDSQGTARFNPVDIPGQVDIGGLYSRSTATVNDKDVAVGHSVSTISDVKLLAGLIKIGSVSTVIDTRSDGKNPSSTGSTEVSGLVIGTTGYVVDDKGARPVGVPVPGVGPIPSNPVDIAKAAGITIESIAQSSSQDAETASRQAKGLRITVDTTLFRNIITPATPPAVTDALYSLFNNAPPDQRGRLYYLLAATPKITFILGAGESSSSAIEAIGFDFEPIPEVPGFPDTGGGTGTGGVVAPPALPGDGGLTPELPEAGGPSVSQPDPVLAGGRPNAPASPPVSALLVLGALLVAGVGGWGLTWLRGFAFGAGLLGAGCALGAPSSMPSLHAASLTDGV